MCGHISMGKASVILALNNVMSHRKYSFTVNSVNLLQYFPVHATAFHCIRTWSIIFSCTYLFGLNYIILYHTRENGENAFKVFWGWWFNHSFRYKDRNVCVYACAWENWLGFMWYVVYIFTWPTHRSYGLSVAQLPQSGAQSPLYHPTSTTKAYRNNSYALGYITG